MSLINSQTGSWGEREDNVFERENFNNTHVFVDLSSGIIC